MSLAKSEIKLFLFIGSPYWIHHFEFIIFILNLVKKYLGVIYSGQVTGVNISGCDIDSLMTVGRDGKHKTKINVI